jgi:hypothetical protein
MLIQSGLLSHEILDVVCICCLFLLHDILFVTPDLVLLLFHFQFMLSDLRSTAIGTCLLH